MCHLMFSAEKFAHVTCILDNNLLINLDYTLYSTSNILFLTKTINTDSICEYLYIV